MLLLVTLTLTLLSRRKLNINFNEQQIETLTRKAAHRYDPSAIYFEDDYINIDNIRPVVLNHRAADRYRSVCHLVLGHTEKTL